MQIHQSVQWDIFPVHFPDGELVLVLHLLLETIELVVLIFLCWAQWVVLSTLWWGIAGCC